VIFEADVAANSSAVLPQFSCALFGTRANSRETGLLEGGRITIGPFGHILFPEFFDSLPETEDCESYEHETDPRRLVDIQKSVISCHH
jgi:hypothetical protein